MVPVARRNLLTDPVRLIISVGGVTFAVVLILVVQSLYVGFTVRMGTLAQRLPIELWVLEADTNGFTYYSLVPEERTEQIRQLSGVAGVYRLYDRHLLIEHDGASVSTIVLAVDLPPPLASTHALSAPAPGSVVVDDVLARDAGLSQGDTVEIRDRTFVISAIVDLTGVGVTPFSLMSLDDARATFIVPGYASYLLVDVAPGADADAVAAAIEQASPELRVLTKEAFAETMRKEVSATFLPIISVLIVVAFLIGTAVVGITIYTATVERAREYGILKAIGATRGDLFRIVLTQSLLVGVAGLLLGVPLSFAVNELAAWQVPQFITLIRWRDVGAVGAAAIGMAVVATVIPVRRVAGIDPASVFRA